MKRTVKILFAVAITLLILVGSIAVGSVNLTPGQVAEILMAKLSGKSGTIDPNLSAIVWGMRFPRAVLAFLTGAALSASGTVMQSILKNSLASSYTLGVSSGASLCAALVMVTGVTFPLLGSLFTLPAAGFAGGLATVFLALAFAARLDSKMENQTVILVGMVFSLFVNAILTLITALSREHLQQMVFWQMGGFTGRNWSHVAVMCPVLVLSMLALQRFTTEMDIMSFGEEQAMSIGVDLKRVKLLLIGIAALLTGTAVSLVGVIGFVDPDATINVIRDGKLVEKRHFTLPERIVNVLKCRNPRCITTVEPGLDQVFFLSDRESHTYRCLYCEAKAER